MFMKSLVFSAATVAAVAALSLAAPAPASANDAAVAAGAVGLVGGMILGSAIASQPPGPAPVVVERRPVRVYEDEEEIMVPRRCWREEWQDRWGDIHVRRVCR